MLETFQDVDMLERLMRLAETDPLAAAVAGYVPAPALAGPLLSECIAKHLKRLEGAKREARAKKGKAPA